MGLFDFFKKKQEPSIPPEALALWVHRSSHFAQLGKLMEDRDETPFQYWNMGPVFGAAPALRTNQGLLPLSAQHLEALQLDIDAAFDKAMENTVHAFPAWESDDGLLRWRGPTADAVVVLGSTILQLLPVKAPLLMMLPAEGLVLAANAHDERAVARMLEEAEAAYAASGEFRSLRTVVYQAGAEAPVPEEWFAPEQHPLGVRFDRAALRSMLTELEGEHQVFAADQAPFAHHAIVEDGDGVVLHAAWARDSDVVVPWITNDLVLLDTPDQPLPKLNVSFDLFREVFPAAIEPLVFDDETEPEDAHLFRLRGALFPTAHERKFLLQRNAFLSQSPDAEAREVAGAELLADFDGGATLLVTAGAGDRAGLVHLTSPDGRTAHVAPSAFGARADRLPPVDRHRYLQSFFVQKMTRLMLGGEVDESETPAMPEGLAEQASSSRPTLLSSNELRRMRSEFAGKSEELGAQLALTRLDTWEPAHLFPVVRPPGYDQGAAENERGMARGLAGGDVEVINPTKPLSRPAPEGLRLDLVSDRGNRMMLINGASMHEDLQQTMWRTALLNLEAASVKPLKQEAEGRYAGDWHDDYDFSRLLLLPRLVNACKVQGTPLVFAPTVGRTWITGSDDVAGLTAVLDAIDAHFASGEATSPYQFRQLLFGWPWTVRGDALVRWTVPAGHPLASRIEALDASLARRRSESRKHVGQFAEQVSRPAPEGREPQA